MKNLHPSGRVPQNTLVYPPVYFLRFPTGMHGMPKRTVYILRSGVDPTRQYIGVTDDLSSRLHWHNNGPSGHTVHHRPWSVVVSMEFSTEQAAIRFERYLKTGSRRAFAKRHFAP